MGPLTFRTRARAFLNSVRRARAFTLVELLVVIGVITVLIAILLPVIGKARQQAQRVACASNLRQLGQALLMYAGENRQYLPLPAEDRYPTREDWVHWQPDRKVEESALWSYLGKSDKILRCPAGVKDHPWLKYPYSYGINLRMSGWRHRPSFTDMRPMQAMWAEPAVRLTKIKGSVRKVLALEENSDAIDDGAWGRDIWVVSREPWIVSHLLSVRHYGTGSEESDSAHLNFYKGRPDARRGNVVFLDGHCGFIPRGSYLLADGFYDTPADPGWPGGE